MSNEVMNQHIAFGSPLGDSEGIIEIAEWAGDMLCTARHLLEMADCPADAKLSEQWLAVRAEWMKGNP